MKKVKTFETLMLDKYPNLWNITACHICAADLQYLLKIHRIDMEWYCNKCYIKYKGG